MGKVTDLRREVKERLSKKDIIDLSELRLRPINIDRNRKKVENSFNRIMFRIGDALIAETLNSNLSDEEKIKKIEDLINIHDIKAEINIVSDTQVKRLIKSFNKEKICEETSLNIKINLNKEIAETYSSLHFEPKKSQEGTFYFKDNPNIKTPFSSFKKLVGTIYYYNNLKKYVNSNKDMSNLILLRYINQQGEYISSEHKDLIIKELKELGFQPSTNNKEDFFLDTYSKQYVKKIERGEIYDYFNWESPEQYFNSLDHIFLKLGNDRYMINSVKYPKLVAHFYNYMYELNKEEENEVKEERRISSDYATSYETKKNIPQKVLDEMENSKFLSHFGYVEYDELVDLDKVKIVEKEWEEVNKQIKFPIVKNHSLRFRRLGKHKAAGLYFYNARAVCIDIRTPSSFIHEILHMIDYTTLPDATLSSLFNFRPIIERYREVTNDKMNKLNDDDPHRKRWNGGGKYNKDYYHNAKEIFARCGEIYIKEILKIDNSLIDTSNPIIYPVDDKLLMDLIKNYYPTVIDTNKEETKEKLSASSKSIVEEIEEVLKNNQISIFDVI